MMEYFNEIELLTNAQHTCRQGHSTNTALVHVVDKWLSSTDESKSVGVVLSDITTDFDVTDDCIFIEKLK